MAGDARSTSGKSLALVLPGAFGGTALRARSCADRQPKRTAVPDAVTISIEPPWPTVS